MLSMSNDSNAISAMILLCKVMLFWYRALHAVKLGATRRENSCNRIDSHVPGRDVRLEFPNFWNIQNMSSRMATIL